MSSWEISRPVWNILLSKRQEFLDNFLIQIPITPNQQGNFDQREEILASARAQVMDTSGNEKSDLDDIEFIWENCSLGDGCCLQARKGYPISINNLQGLGDGRSSNQNPHSVGWGRKQRELSSHNSLVWASDWTSQFAQKSSWKMDWKSTGICLEDCLNNFSVCMFVILLQLIRLFHFDKHFVPK